MTWQEMNEKAAALTAEETAELEKQVIRYYADVIKEIEAQLAAQYAKLAGVKPEDYYNEILKYNRLNTLLSDVRAAYIDASRNAGKTIGAASELAMVNQYYRQMYIASWLDEYPEIDVGALPRPLIDITVYSRDTAWAAISKKVKDDIQRTFGTIDQYYPQSGTLSEILAKNLTAELQKISDAITTGLAQGKSYTSMMESIKDVIGWQLKKDGQISLTGAMANALRIIRTECNRTLNAGTHAADQDLVSQGFPIEKEWLAVLDDRVRPEHAELDGQRRPIDQPFSNGEMYPSGFNCRCTTMTIVDGVGPSLRRGKNPATGEYEIMEFKSFNSWASENGLEKNKYGQLYKKE